MQWEQLGLAGALTAAVIALWKAYLDKSKQVDQLLAAVTRTLALVENALERNEAAMARFCCDTKTCGQRVVPGETKSQP